MGPIYSDNNRNKKCDGYNYNSNLIRTVANIYLLSTRHYTKCFVCVKSVNP